MKRALLTLAALAVAVAVSLPTTAHAQSVNVSAVVSAFADGTTIQALDFGTIDPGTSPAVLPLDFTGGRIDVSHNATFTISATVTALSLDGLGGETIPGTYHCALSDDANVEVEAYGNATNCTTNLNRTAVGNGTTRVWVGGELTVPAAATPGNYSGSLSFSITNIGS